MHFLSPIIIFISINLSSFCSADNLSETHSNNNNVYPSKQLFVEDIKITGTSDYEKNKIKSLLHCQPRNLWLFRKGDYSIEKLKDDEKKIQYYFINSGFFDSITKISADNISPHRVNINVNIIKGPEYKLGTIIWNQQLLSSNIFARLKNKLTFPDNTVYTPGLTDIIRKEINNFCVEIMPQQPDLTIMPIISRESEPCNPIVDIIITLRKGYLKYGSSALNTPTFSYPASLAHEYLYSN